MFPLYHCSNVATSPQISPSTWRQPPHTTRFFLLCALSWASLDPEGSEACVAPSHEARCGAIARHLPALAVFFMVIQLWFSWGARLCSQAATCAGGLPCTCSPVFVPCSSSKGCASACLPSCRWRFRCPDSSLGAWAPCTLLEHRVGELWESFRKL